MRNTIIIAAIALYFTQVGTKALADCSYGGDSYTVGSSVCQDDGFLHVCIAAGSQGCNSSAVDCWIRDSAGTRCDRPDQAPTRILFEKPFNHHGSAAETTRYFTGGH
jgi:hypothetical protein